MKLSDILLQKTATNELCCITVGGWISAMAFIDNEDRFIHYIPQNLLDKPVVREHWDFLTVIDSDGEEEEIPCHFIDV